jgi:hypothetical protein
MFPHRDRGFRKKPQNRSRSIGITGHVAPESPVTFNRNRRSRCFGNLGHLGPEYAQAAHLDGRKMISASHQRYLGAAAREPRGDVPAHGARAEDTDARRRAGESAILSATKRVLAQLDDGVDCGHFAGAARKG